MAEVTETMKKADDQPQLFTLRHRDKAKLQTVALKDVDVPNSQSFDLQELTALGDSIRRVGLINKPTVMREGHRYVVLVGRRRMAAMQLLSTLDPEFTETQAYVREGRTTSESDVAKLVLTENARRSSNVLAELEAINTLMKQDRMSVVGVAKSVGQNHAWVRKRLELNLLNVKFLGEMRKGRLKFETARVIAKLDRRQQSEVWARFAAKRQDDPDAVISGKDISDATSRETTALPQEMFGRMPTVDGAAALINRLETYGFEMEAGPLSLCQDWIDLKALIAGRE